MSYLNKNDPAVLWYPKDFLADTQLLSNEDVGILMRFKAMFFSHGRVDRNVIENALGAIPNSLNKLILEDSTGKLFDPKMEITLRDRKKHSDQKSKDGKKGNEVKRLMNELDCSKEEARQILEDKKGYKFGKNKHSPSVTPSERNKGNAIGDRNYYTSSNSNKASNNGLWAVWKKYESGEELTSSEKETVLKIESGELMLP